MRLSVTVTDGTRAGTDTYSLNTPNAMFLPTNILRGLGQD